MTIKPIITNTNLLAYYPMNEGSGTTANDISGNGYNGTITGATWVKNNYGGSYSLDFPHSTNNNVDTGFVPPTGANPRTVVAWVKPGAYNASGTSIFGYGVSLTGEKWNFKLDASGYLRIEIAGSGYTSTFLLSLNQWYFVAITYDGTDLSGHTLYVDGNSENATGTTTVNTSSSNTGRIGYSPADTGQYWDGLIDNVMIFDKELSAEEIKAIYNNTYRV